MSCHSHREDIIKLGRYLIHIYGLEILITLPNVIGTLINLRVDLILPTLTLVYGFALVIIYLAFISISISLPHIKIFYYSTSIKVNKYLYL